MRCYTFTWGNQSLLTYLTKTNPVAIVTTSKSSADVHVGSHVEPLTWLTCAKQKQVGPPPMIQASTTVPTWILGRISASLACRRLGSRPAGVLPLRWRPNHPTTRTTHRYRAQRSTRVSRHMTSHLTKTGPCGPDLTLPPHHHNTRKRAHRRRCPWQDSGISYLLSQAGAMSGEAKCRWGLVWVASRLAPVWAKWVQANRKNCN
jgi:hypothetical protein